jgi:hypothetical protein
VADTIYSFISHPAYQNGYTLSGTITTDGNMGQLSQSDINAWSWTATNGANTYSVNSAEPGAEVYPGSANLYAGSDYLAIPLVEGDGLSLLMTPTTAAGQVLQLGAHTDSVLSSCHGPTGNLSPWWTDYISPIPDEVSTPAGNAWMIADDGAPTSVPEPSSLVLACLALPALAGVFYLRRRNATS